MKGDEYAGFWIRVGANLIDLIIFVVIYGVLSILSMYLFSDLYLQNVNYQTSYSSFDFFELFFQYLLILFFFKTFMPFVAKVLNLMFIFTIP